MRPSRIRDLILILLFFIIFLTIWHNYRSISFNPFEKEYPVNPPTEDFRQPLEDVSYACPPCKLDASESRSSAPQLSVELSTLQGMFTQRKLAVSQIVNSADIALRNTSVYSVTIKPQLAPSGDRHDYLSLAKYFWPDESKPGGLPYIGRDGHINPEVEEVKDFRLLRQMMREVQTLGMAYFWTRNEEYAKKATERLNEWFLAEETYMNPNLNYASFRKGTKLGRRTGVLDMMQVYRMFDGVQYLRTSSHYTQNLHNGLIEWFTKYLEWFRNSPQGKLEYASHNNHGTYYDVQHIALLRFLGRFDEAKKVAEESKVLRIDNEIRANGEQPGELARPTSWFYSIFNLQGLILLAQQAQHVGVDVWNHIGPEGQSIRQAMRFMLPYAVSGGAGWPVRNIKGFPVDDLYKVLEVGYLVYGDAEIWDTLKKLEAVRAAELKEKNLQAKGDFTCELSILTNSQLWNCF
ncbi:uncharacterized protein VTP21DRAFT_6616 [Calcarisporiella thermophila]|uniref:uncharacterized protein n=1 Tax=Calcarisporiella thermophila TaxID=911321 RepID=UPI00374425F7